MYHHTAYRKPVIAPSIPRAWILKYALLHLQHSLMQNRVCVCARARTVAQATDRLIDLSALAVSRVHFEDLCVKLRYTDTQNDHPCATEIILNAY